MNKKTCIAFLFFLACLTALTACTRSSRYGKVIVDSKGMEHILMTDANGVTVCDKFGNLVEVGTDSDSKKPIAAPTENGTLAEGQSGEYQTQSVTFPDVMENGDVLEQQYFSVTVPEGWENVGTGRIILRHTQTGAQVSFYPDLGTSLEDKLEQMDNDRAALDADFEYNETEATVDGFNAVCGTYEIGDIVRTVYVFKTDRDMVTEITCTVQKDSRDAVDFDSVLSAVHFK